MSRYRFLHFVGIATLVCLLLSVYASPRDGGQPSPATSADPKISDATALKLLDHQLANYQQTLTALNTNLALQLAFVALGLLVLTSRRDHLKVPVIDIYIPRSWLHFLVPFGSLYLWLRFGFLLDSLIKSRLYGWSLIHGIGLPSESAGFRGAAALFEDSGFLDGWFLLFRDEHKIDKTFNSATAVFFVVGFCVLLAATHAVIIAALYVGNRRYGAFLRSSWGKGMRLVSAIPAAVFALLLLSHLQFCFGGRNVNWAQAVVGILAVLLCYGFVCASDIRATPPLDELDPEQE